MMTDNLIWFFCCMDNAFNPLWDCYCKIYKGRKEE